MSETVLVIDDHSLVLTTLVSTLSQAGFRVLAAASGEEALEIASNAHHPIDLMICDVILPGMPGTEIARRIAEIHPETRCLFITGLPDHPRILTEIAASGKSLLPKPFLPHVLVRTAREILGIKSCVMTAAF
jgi:two-component system, cell cycle sensor histidine kinase and response regulator CckA